MKFNHEQNIIKGKYVKENLYKIYAAIYIPFLIRICVAGWVALLLLPICHTHKTVTMNQVHPHFRTYNM